MTTTESYYSEDLISRKSFGQILEDFTLTEHSYVDGGLVISLNGSFGSGKSTFLKMWSDDLKQRRAGTPTLPLPVTINAWECDFLGDPFLAIISALTTALGAQGNSDRSRAQPIREAAKDIASFGFAIANDIVARSTGVNAMAAGDRVKANKTAARKVQNPSVDLLTAFEHKRLALGRLKSALKVAFEGEAPKAIVMLDELDRCRPDYAISYLETIKHIFDIHGIVFLLAVDESQLSSAASVLFGANIRFSEYYRKFAHRTINLPMPTKGDLQKISSEYVRRYLLLSGARASMLSERNLSENITTMLSCLGVSMRQTQEIFRTLGHACSKPSEYNQQYAWGYAAGMVFMAALRVAKFESYERFGKGVIEPYEIMDVLDGLVKSPSPRQWWFNLLAAALWRENDARWESELRSQMVKCGIVASKEEGTVDVRRILSEHAQGWSGILRSNPLRTIYRRYESATSVFNENLMARDDD